jgi:hypothetical protein
VGADLPRQHSRPLPGLRRAVLGAHVSRREHAAGELFRGPNLLAFTVLTYPAGRRREGSRWLTTARFSTLICAGADQGRREHA